MIKLTKYLQEFTNGAKIEEINIGCSNTNVYKIEKEGKAYFLKVGQNPHLLKSTLL